MDSKIEVWNDWKSHKQTLETSKQEKKPSTNSFEHRKHTQKHFICQLKHKKVNYVCVDARFFIISIHLESLVAINKFTKSRQRSLAFSCFFSQYSGNNKNEHSTKRMKSKISVILILFVWVSVWNEVQTVCFVIFVTANAHIQISVGHLKIVYNVHQLWLSQLLNVLFHTDTQTHRLSVWDGIRSKQIRLLSKVDM